MTLIDSPREKSNAGRPALRSLGLGIEPIGPAPAHLSPAAAEVWREMTAVMWWLRASDRVLLGAVCRLEALARTGEAQIREINALISALPRLGGSPLTRAKACEHELAEPGPTAVQQAPARNRYLDWDD
jgi:hypothetical protein